MFHLRARRRTTGLIVVLLAMSVGLLGAGVDSSSAAVAPPLGTIHVQAKHVAMRAPVTGRSTSGRVIRGVFIPKSFHTSNGKMTATGVLRGRIVRPGADRLFRKIVTMRVAAVDGHGTAAPAARTAAAAASAFPPPPGPGACNVLNLVLGPLDLNILGLQVHLNRVVLNIIAQTGAGQLLGNLLCFVAGLLDGGTPLSNLLTQVTALLNRLLGALGTLTQA